MIDLDYLDKLVDENSNTCLCSVDKKPIHADYSVLPEEIEMNHEAHKFKVDDGARIKKYIFFQQSLHQNLVKKNICD